MSRLISPWTKWLPFHRQHLQMYFHKWKWLKSFVFWFKFHWSLFPRVQLTTNKSALVQVMAQHPFGAEPLPEPMLTQLTDAYICGTSGDESRVNVFPQWYLSLSVFRTSVSESMPGVSPIISESEDSITVRWVLESTGIDTMGKGWFDSLAPGRCSCNFVSVIFKLISSCPWMNNPGLHCWLVNVGSGNGSVPQATSHHMSQYWPRSLLPYVVTLGHHELKYNFQIY